VKSTAGVGSTFTIRLPFELAAAPTAEPGARSAKLQVSFDRLRVLAADDNAVNREVLEQTLGLLGIEPVIVENGWAAVEAFKSQAFDVVFMDCSMPVLDGYAATREIRAWESEQQRTPVPVIALTAFVIGKQAEAWRDAGMSDCLTKPFTVRGLTDCLSRHAAERARYRDNSVTNATDAGVHDKPSTDAPVLERDILDGIVSMDKNGSLLARVVGLFVSTTPSCMRNLEAAIETGSAEDVAAAAHSLKSMSLTIGARRVAAIAGGIEADAPALSGSRDGTRIRELTAEVEKAIDALQALLGSSRRDGENAGAGAAA